MSGLPAGALDALLSPEGGTEAFDKVIADSQAQTQAILAKNNYNAQQIAKNNTIAQPMLCNADMVHRYRTSAGATPKLMKSARLSSSAPKRDVDFNSRAIRPSSPSNTPATMIA